MRTMEWLACCRIRNPARTQTKDKDSWCHVAKVSQLLWAVRVLVVIGYVFMHFKLLLFFHTQPSVWNQPETGRAYWEDLSWFVLTWWVIGYGHTLALSLSIEVAGVQPIGKNEKSLSQKSLGHWPVLGLSKALIITYLRNVRMVKTPKVAKAIELIAWIW